MNVTVKNVYKKYFLINPKVAAVFVLFAMSLLITVYSMRKDITVIIDGEETQIVTYRQSMKSILESNQIYVGPKDKVIPSIDSKVENGDKIYIKKASNVEVEVDGKILTIATSEENVGSMLQEEGIVVNDLDKVQPLMSEAIEEDMKIVVTRVESEIIKESQPIDFSTVVKKDDNLENTVTLVEQEGEVGEREISTRVVYEDGQEVSRQVIGHIVKKNPIQKVLVQGTLGVLNLSRGGSEKVLYKSSLNVKATAYTSYDPGVGTITATGTTVKRNPNGYSTIAVDPNVIPLGSKVYVEGYGFAIAEDTGGAIKGNRIDVFMHSLSEANTWGVKNVTVYILK